MKYTVVINEGLGFTEIRKVFSTVLEAIQLATRHENARIYNDKGKRLV